MLLEQRQWTPTQGWCITQVSNSMSAPQFVLLFGDAIRLQDASLLSHLKERYPGASLLGCSTAGEIAGTKVSDGSVVATAVHLERSQIVCRAMPVREDGCFDAGKEVASLLEPRGLVHAFVLSDGHSINGSELARGLVEGLPPGVAVTGGMAGDGTRFAQTMVFLDTPRDNIQVALLGFYGERLRVGYSSMGGWDSFGPERLITRASRNVLYELDGQSALQLYKKYLGEYAAGLPASALLFPLSLRSMESGVGLVRTVLKVSEEDQSMIFAGDVPEGEYARFMKANSERLIEGALGAAKASLSAVGAPPDLALLISCVGRKMVLKQRVEEEVEGVREIFGGQTVLAGFYSYGEISPFHLQGRCELHNQTMTVTTLKEI
jgi:hypothetical protein